MRAIPPDEPYRFFIRLIVEAAQVSFIRAVGVLVRCRHGLWRNSVDSTGQLPGLLLTGPDSDLSKLEITRFPRKIKWLQR